MEYFEQVFVCRQSDNRIRKKELLVEAVKVNPPPSLSCIEKTLTTIFSVLVVVVVVVVPLV